MPSSLHLRHPINTFSGGCHHKQQSQPSPTTLTSCFPLPHDVSLPETVLLYHVHTLRPNQCCSAVVQSIESPVETVWSFVRRFDNPQAYKHFLKSCHVISGDGNVGSLHEVHVVPGLPAGSSTERLEILDNDRHMLSFSVVGGDHRLRNYRSVTTLHVSPTGKSTVVVESFIVDVPPGNTREDTCVFVDTIVRFNLQSLAQMAENMSKTETHHYNLFVRIISR